MSTDTNALIARAIAAWQLTEGSFDPTVGAALVALGYDRDFAEVAWATSPPPPQATRSRHPVRERSSSIPSAAP